MWPLHFTALITVVVMVAECHQANNERPLVYLPSCNTSLIGTWMSVFTEEGATTRVAQFLGVPFALPPTGQRRFTYPEDAACPCSTSLSSECIPHQATQLFNATVYERACVQNGQDGGSEDCLYLNVYVPEVVLLTANYTLVPVVFYIHGGSLIQGSGNFEQLQFLAAFAGGRDDVVAVNTSVITVTVNYRLGLFGFLAIESQCGALQQPCGNYGIWDQLSALHWVHAHIDVFGGDPSRVTIMGQSSGGTSVFALMASPMTRGLFWSGLALSGSPNISMSRKTKLVQDAGIAAQLGCSNGTQQLSCLQSVSVADLQNAMPGSWTTPAMFTNAMLNNESALGEDYPGLVFVDGVLIPQSVWETILFGGSAVGGSPALMFGNMGQECALMNPTPSVANDTLNQFTNFMATRVLQTWRNATYVATQLTEEYYLNASRVSPQLTYDSFNADYGLTCAFHGLARRLPRDHSNRSSSSSFPRNLYLYYHQWAPQYPVLGLSEHYAFHAWDYVNACHNWLDYTLYVPGPRDLNLSRLQRSQWFTLWSTGVAPPDWPSVASSDVSPQPLVYLYAHQDVFPYRASGITHHPYLNDEVCPFVVDQLGMDERYWWCN